VSPLARTQLFEGNELGDKNHLAYIDSIALGCMAAIIGSKMNFVKWLSSIFTIVGWSMIVLIFVFKGFVYKSGITELGLNVTILSIGVSLILLWVHQKSQLKKEKKWIIYNWLRLLGIYSYEIYLTHMFVIILMASIYSEFELNDKWLIPFLLFSVLISYLTGQLIFNYFSDPVNNWLRTKRIENKKM
jgi:peptidoglycan/LPS O-acetylase OafA/YrhL